MKPRYALFLTALLIAPLAAAQQVDTVIVRRAPVPLIHTIPPEVEIDEHIIVRPGSDEVVYYIRRFGGDSTLAGIGPLPEGRRFFYRTDSLRIDSLGIARFGVWSDSTHQVFRVHADSLRLDGPMRLFGRRPGARVERDVEVLVEGDSAVIRLRRGPDAAQRLVVPRANLQRPETRPDGVLVVPDGKGGTWVYLPPKEE